jgi:uncharacterized membrane protein YvbJ
LRCPGCGAELAEGSIFCSHCGGRIEGSAVNYSRAETRAADIYENRTSESSSSDSLSVADETLIGIGSIRFVLILVALPFLGLLALFSGLENDRTDHLAIGIVFLVLSVFMIILYFKYYREKGEVDVTEPEKHFSKYQRRV